MNNIKNINGKIYYIPLLLIPLFISYSAGFIKEKDVISTNSNKIKDVMIRTLNRSLYNISFIEDKINSKLSSHEQIKVVFNDLQKLYIKTKEITNASSFYHITEKKATSTYSSFKPSYFFKNILKLMHHSEQSKFFFHIDPTTKDLTLCVANKIKFNDEYSGLILTKNNILNIISNELPGFSKNIHYVQNVKSDIFYNILLSTEKYAYYIEIKKDCHDCPFTINVKTEKNSIIYHDQFTFIVSLLAVIVVILSIKIYSYTKKISSLQNSFRNKQQEINMFNIINKEIDIFASDYLFWYSTTNKSMFSYPLPNCLRMKLTPTSLDIILERCKNIFLAKLELENKDLTFELQYNPKLEFSYAFKIHYMLICVICNILDTSIEKNNIQIITSKRNNNLFLKLIEKNALKIPESEQNFKPKPILRDGMQETLSKSWQEIIKVADELNINICRVMQKNNIKEITISTELKEVKLDNNENIIKFIKN